MSGLRTSVWRWREALRLAEVKESSSQDLKAQNSIPPPTRIEPHALTNRGCGRHNIREAGPNAVRRVVVWWADASDELIEAFAYPGLWVAWKREFLDKLQRRAGRAAGGAITGDRVEALLRVQRKRVEEVDEAQAHVGWVVLYWAISWVQSGWALVILPLPYILIL